MIEAPNPLSRLLSAAARAQAALAAAEDGMLAELGLTRARMRLLEALEGAGSPRTVPQLARALGLTRQAVQRVADETTARGLLRADPNPDHARARLYSATGEGREALEKAIEIKVMWLHDLGRGLPAAGLEIAAELLVLVARRAARKPPETG